MASLDAVLPLLSPHSHNFVEWETILKQRLCPLFPYIGSAILKNAVPSTRFAHEPHTRDFIFDDLFADVPTFPRYPRDTTGYDTAAAIRSSPTAVDAPATPSNIARRLRSRTTASTVNLAPAPTTPLERVAASIDAALDASSPRPTAFSLNVPSYWNLPLTPAAQLKFDKDSQLYHEANEAYVREDNKLLALLMASHSPDSMLSMRASPHWIDYPEGCSTKSLLFWRTSRQVHMIGSADVAMARTTAFFNTTMDPTSSHEKFMSVMLEGLANLNADWGTLDPTSGAYFIRSDHLASCIYLKALPQLFTFPVDKLLSENKTGRFDNLRDVMATMHSYQMKHDLTTGATPDKLGHGLLSAPTPTRHFPSPPPATPNAVPTHAPCSLCTAAKRTRFASSHTTLNCMANPNGPKFNPARIAHWKQSPQPRRAPLTSPSPVVPSSAPSPSRFNSTRARAYVTLLESLPSDSDSYNSALYGYQCYLAGDD